MSARRPHLALLLLVLSWAALSAVAVLAPAQSAAQSEVVCGEEDDFAPEVDEDGILLDPDDSTEEERANDYDDSAEDEEIPADEGDSLSPKELEAMLGCLNAAVNDSWTEAADAFDAAWDGQKSLLLGTFGSDELPYGGTVEFSLEAGGGALTASASKAKKTVLGKSTLKLRSGDTKKLKFKLNKKGLKALRKKGRIAATGKLTITDKLSGKSRTKKSRIVIKGKR